MPQNHGEENTIKLRLGESDKTFTCALSKPALIFYSMSWGMKLNRIIQNGVNRRRFCQKSQSYRPVISKVSHPTIALSRSAGRWSFFRLKYSMFKLHGRSVPRCPRTVCSRTNVCGKDVFHIRRIGAFRSNSCPVKRVSRWKTRQNRLLRQLCFLRSISESNPAIWRRKGRLRAV